MQTNLGAARFARPLSLAAFVYLTVCSLSPIRSYDYFWHLASGRWIFEHQTLPLRDPFGVASDPTPWINGAWLFQIPLFALHVVGGHLLVQAMRAVLIAATFALGLGLVLRRLPAGLSLLLTLVCWWGGSPLMGTRPSTMAAFFCLLALLTLTQAVGPRRAVLYALLTVLWINTHPSGLLAPVIALVWGAGEASAERGRLRDVARLTGLSSLSLLLNPFGWRGVFAPIALTRWVGSGEFVNAEWLPSLPLQFPLFYSTLLLAAALIIASPARSKSWSQILLLGVFAILAVSAVRHQLLYFATYPLLIAPLIEPLVNQRWQLVKLSTVASLAVALLGLTRIEPRPAVDDKTFPIRSARRLAESGLRGNIFNADQFGGFLIWTFYPDRRVLTDGRNELYRQYIPLDRQARADGRVWKELLNRYAVDLAVDEYRPSVSVRLAGQSSERRLAATEVFFPRREWALIAFDDVALVFARRAAFLPERIAPFEFRYLVPDDLAATSRVVDRDAVVQEIERARREIGPRSQVVSRLESVLTANVPPAPR